MEQSPDLSALGALEARESEWVEVGGEVILRVIDERDNSTVAYKAATREDALEGVLAQLRQRREAQEREQPPESPE